MCNWNELSVQERTFTISILYSQGLRSKCLVILLNCMKELFLAIMKHWDPCISKGKGSKRVEGNSERNIHKNKIQYKATKK